MLPETVTAIKNSRRTLEDVLTSVKPLNHDEWKAFIKITNAVATLQSIDFSKLAQLPMPETGKKEGEQPVLPLEPETECPTCHGRCTVEVGDGTQGICATCKGVGKVKASTVKKIASSDESETHPDVIQQAKVAADAYNLSSKEPTITMHCTKETLDKITAIDSSQSLAEETPRLLGLFELEGKMYACTRSESVEGHTRAWCYEVLLADNFHGITSSKPDETGYVGVKATYKGKDYVLIASEIQFLPFLPETAPRHRRSSKPKAKKQADQKGAVETPAVT